MTIYYLRHFKSNCKGTAIYSIGIHFGHFARSLKILPLAGASIHACAYLLVREQPLPQVSSPLPASQGEVV